MEYADLTLLTAILILVMSASFLGGITYTGNILTSSGACGPFGCDEICTVSSDCVSGLACCPSSWNVGFCDKQENCDSIAIFTRTHSQDPIQKVPERIEFDRSSEIGLPILISLMSVSVVFIVLWFLYRMPEQRMRRVGGED